MQEDCSLLGEKLKGGKSEKNKKQGKWKFQVKLKSSNFNLNGDLNKVSDQNVFKYCFSHFNHFVNLTWSKHELFPNAVLQKLVNTNIQSIMQPLNAV